VSGGARRVSVAVGKFDAAIFDLDGVITQTARVHAAAWKELFDAYRAERSMRGLTVFAPFDKDFDYRVYVDGRPRYDGVRAFLASRGISLAEGKPNDPPTAETVCGLGNRKDAYFWTRVKREGVEPYPSTVSLVRELRAAGLKTGVFSASRNAVPILRAASVLDLFDERVDGVVADELHLAGKPAPAMVLELARRLGAVPERTIVFEDAIAGVQAGRAGGFGLVIGVNRSSHEGQLLANGADIEVTDLAAVVIEAGVNKASRHG
jgi:alpha,alpha-trehalase